MRKFRLRLSFSLAALILMTVSSVSAQTASDGSTNPAVIKAVAPVFPAIARAARASGRAIVKVTINPKGEVTATKLVSGHPLLKAVSLEAAKRWLFSVADKKEAERYVDLEFIYTEATVKEEAGVFFLPPYRIEIIPLPPEINY